MRWNIEPTLFSWPPFELRYYGLLFALGLFLCAFHGPRYFRAFGLPPEHASRLTLWVPVGMLIGAHYIHLIFYEPAGLSDLRLGWNAEEGHMVLGRFWNLGSGLASHGGALGCLVALIAFWWRRGKPLGIGFHRYGDALMLSSVWVYPFVRLGNFMNSEIVGRPTDVPWGVIFERHYSTPRHPVQLYEAALYFVEIAVAVWLVKHRAGKLREGAIMYGMLALHFSFRFVCEFFKESQAIDQGWSLNMGHLLSAPIVIGCAYLVLATQRFSLIAPLTEAEVAHNDEAMRRAAEREAEKTSSPEAGAAEAMTEPVAGPALQAATTEEARPSKKAKKRGGRRS
ncbi:MAG: prolipoprotein diacylglyceryl transferase [Deltaproteobacteria bacterium]|nr:prolipoprotein diacylglyceryl transferase [Deltaproteobacteria bacterium]